MQLKKLADELNNAIIQLAWLERTDGPGAGWPANVQTMHDRLRDAIPGLQAEFRRELTDVLARLKTAGIDAGNVKAFAVAVQDAQRREELPGLWLAAEADLLESTAEPAKPAKAVNRPSRRGRPQVGNGGDRKIFEDWQSGGDAIGRKEFARLRGMTAEQLGRLIDRERQRQNRRTKPVK